ncbi:hypothetical protein [Streptomyces sp. WMMB 322]|uniref:hypothetical protein n=1 Tax=Streptomyces sp. WMMB 322 TaxID=1286821 RepID=UPI0020C7C6E0|nr:hypothetical protein [Streptomyces sp. WMMB 322]
MADFQQDLVLEALSRLGSGRAEMREANRRWQAMLHAQRGRRSAAGRYRSVLGPPERAERRALGDLDCEVLTWPVPLWPDLRFEVLTVPGGGVNTEWLVRAAGAAAPALRTVEDLRPWSCTVEEVARAFAPAQPLEGSAPTRWRLGFAAPDGAGERYDVIAEFSWGLLQRLPRMERTERTERPEQG